MNATETSTTPNCPVCDGTDLVDCVRISGVPVYCNVLHDSRDAARGAAKGDIDLRFCNGCGHLFNAAFDPLRVEYSGDYENSLHYSGRFQDYARSLADHLVEIHDLRGKTVIEIACGQGDFLRLLCAAGAGRGIGFDPGHRPESVKASGGCDLTFIPDYYSETYAEHRADLICCRHALEHIQRPGDFLVMLRRAIGDGGTPLFFEVPDALFTLQDLGVWDIIYEHCGYFTESSLKRVFMGSGFDVSRVETEFGGQFLGLHGLPGPTHDQTPGDGAAFRPLVDRFALEYEKKVERWRSRLRDLRNRGRRAVLWGAGSKGVSFMNALGVSDEMDCLIDLNPHKHGRFIPGTGHQVRSPETLAGSRPDAVIVMNPLYAAEIAADLRAMGVEAEMLLDDAE